jgi:hypothetical protein
VSLHLGAGAIWRERNGRFSASDAAPALVALSVPAIAVWTACYGTRWQVEGGDYSRDYAPAMDALLNAHIGTFLARSPTNGAGGSLVLRAPFGLLAKWVSGGDEFAIFSLAAVACILCLSSVGVWLALGRMRAGVAPASCIGVVAVYLGAPALLQAVYFGHPEECLGAALAVGATLLASRGRPRLAGMLLGAAVINKPWGILAVGPVLLCARAHWKQTLIGASGLVGCWLAAGLALAPSHFWITIRGAESGAYVAHPQDLWWPFAHTVARGYARPPAFLEAHARQIAVALAMALALALLASAKRRRHVDLDVRRCLALLALSFALRCLLDPSAHIYYQLPLVVALAAWEVSARRSVTLSLATLIALSLDFRRFEEASAVVPFLVYLMVVLPLCVRLLGDVFGSNYRRARLDSLLVRFTRRRSAVRV